MTRTRSAASIAARSCELIGAGFESCCLLLADYRMRKRQRSGSIEVLGTDITPKPDGSLYQMKTYPRAGYRVAYSRTSGDTPMVITMQKSP
jgi:hypothetical protein